MIDPQGFLREVEDLLGVRRSEALDHVFNTLEDALLKGKHEEVRGVLSASLPYIGKMPESVFLSILVVTRPWRMHFEEERRAIGHVINTEASLRMI